MQVSARSAAALAPDGVEDADRHAPRRAPARARPIVPIALAALLAACATYTPAPIDPAHTAEAFAARRLDQPSLRDAVERVVPHATDAWPPAEWDRAELLAVALTQNGSLAVARAEIDAALAAEITAGELPNPTLGLQSEYARHEPDHWLYGVSFDFLLPQHGVRRIDEELARLGTRGARTQLMEQTWSVRRALTIALSDRESARRRLEVLSHLAEAQDQLLASQRQRVAAGEDAPADLDAAEAMRLEIAQQEAEARADAAAGDAALAAALGMPSTALDGIAIAWPDWGNPPPFADDALNASREQALLSRPDLAVAINEYAESEAKLERAVARQYPQFELKPGYYWDHGIAKWPFDIGLTFPMFSRNRGEIAEAKAAREVAGQKMLVRQADIYGEIEAAFRAEEIARANLDAAVRRGEALHEQLRHVDIALGLGAGNRMERTGVEVLALRAELDIVQARARLQVARNGLEDALHAPLSGPELALARSESAADPGDGR
ncbi:MAG TPA: TolC family protein [Rhodanobacteraceae bacterium]